MSFMTTGMMSPSDTSRGLVRSHGHPRSGTRSAQQDWSEPRRYHSASSGFTTQKDHREPLSSLRTKRCRVVEVDDVVSLVEEDMWSRGSSREFGSVVAEPSDWSSGGRDRGMARRSATGRKIRLPSPPPDESRRFRCPSPPAPERRARDLRGFGSWCEPVNVPSQTFSDELFYDHGEGSSTRGREQSRPPRTPRERLLSTPELSPMSTHFTFCPCCGDEEDRINDTWCMRSKDRMDSQLEYASAYIASVKSGRR
ncbi:hypothetical protein PT974_11179 [Cladobotryum mycophilum]|uniref:Uncharacterized protein n=1 Tax=Cladobotryum mycophilum TaxID=491253 RepID=A0ABR0S5F2_9HYPO